MRKYEINYWSYQVSSFEVVSETKYFYVKDNGHRVAKETEGSSIHNTKQEALLAGISYALGQKTKNYEQFVHQQSLDNELIKKLTEELDKVNKGVASNENPVS